MAIRQYQLHGTRGGGRIARLFIGRGYGFVRLADNREIYFHRADIREGISFNDLSVGDAVTFELFEDRISGPRALQLKPGRRPED
jgi:cold shock CspA family protein